MIGTHIAHYEITAKLGEGGMGEVYRANDTKLNRDVALKILPEQFAADAQRMGRFQREAEVLASLDHPNIGAIYGIEDAGETKALILQLIEGPTLADRIARGAIPLDEALPIARQVAEALEAAHEKGIIHRDLKPANIKITPDGQVKVLDFGLAKALTEEAPQPDISASPTLTAAATQAGLVLGTAAYMSPEQAKGQPADRRSDIWSFGVVLFEMLTGSPVFEADTVSETLAAVLLKDAPLRSLPGSVPPQLGRLIARCLRRELRLRLQSIGDARVALEEAAHTEMAVAVPDAAGPAPAAPAASRLLPWVLAGLMAVALGGSLWHNWTGEPGPGPQIARFAITVSENEVLSLATSPAVAISLDGTKLAYTAQLDGDVRLFLRRIDQLEAVALPGTTGASAPFFSPEGNWLAFFADNELKKVSLTGGPVVTLAGVEDHRGGSWAGDTIVYAPRAVGGIFRIPSTGGEPQPVTQPDESRHERTHRFPRFMPDGRTVLFTVGTQQSPDYYDNARIDAVNLETGQRHAALEGASTAVYLPSGHLVFAREGSLFSVPFDPGRLTTTGQAVTVLQGVSGDVTTGAVHFAVSSTGTLSYVPGSQAQGDLLTRMDRDGNVEPLPVPRQAYLELSLSPDGTRAAVTVGTISDYDIWIYDFTRETMSRLTFGGVNRSPKWSADGTHVLYAHVTSKGESTLYSKAADGSAAAVEIRKLSMGDSPRAFVDDVSPDGKWISILSGDTENISLIPADGRGEVVPFATTEFAESGSAFSPDSRWVAYTSRESGRPEVYVRSLSSVGGRWQVSTTGGEAPRWSRDGQELFYYIGNRMMAAPVQTTPVFQAGTPRLLFDNYFDIRTDAGAVYDVGPDGKWFVAVRPSSEESMIRELHLIQNWVEELKRTSEPE